MSESLPYGEIKFDRIVELEHRLNTPDDSDIGYFLVVDLKNPDEIKEKKQSIFHFVLKVRKLFLILLDHIGMKTNRIVIHKKKRLICGWTDKKNYLV